VLDYVYELTQKTEEANTKLEEHISSLVDEKAELQEKLDAMTAQIETARADENSVREELENERRRNTELNALVAAREEEIRDLQHQTDERSRQLDSYIKRSGEITEKNMALEKTKQEVDQASAQIGKLIIESHTEAERVLKETQEKAGSMIAQAREKAEAVMTDASAQAQRTIEEARVTAINMKDSAQQSIDRAYERYSVFRGEISRLQISMTQTLEMMQGKAGSLSAEIDEVQNMVMKDKSLIDTDNVNDIPAGYSTPAEEPQNEPQEPQRPQESQNPAASSDAGDSPFFRYAAEE